jgi:hypothetical protein
MTRPSGAERAAAPRPLPAGRPPAPLTDRHVAQLRGLARQPLQDRRSATPPETEDLIALGFAASTFVGHAGIEVKITEAGARTLAELGAPPPSSVYDVSAVRAELSAFLDARLPWVGDERTRAFKSNLAFLLDLVVQLRLELELRHLRGTLAGPDGAGAA